MSEIKDSGNRTEFGTGAVRDIQDDKGRCDLMPLDAVAELFIDSMTAEIIKNINKDNIFIYLSASTK